MTLHKSISKDGKCEMAEVRMLEQRHQADQMTLCSAEILKKPQTHSMTTWYSVL